jgi:DNA-directed RNA polymerase specialized sigma24 family protein
MESPNLARVHALTGFRLDGPDLGKFLVACRARLRPRLPSWLSDESETAAGIAAFEANRHPEKFRNISDVHSYASCVAVHAASARRRRNAVVAIGLDDIRKPSCPGNVESEVAARELIEWAMSQLPAEQRRALVAMDAFEFTAPEWAREEGIPVRRVYSLRNSAHKTMKRILARELHVTGARDQVSSRTISRCSSKGSLSPNRQST